MTRITRVEVIDENGRSYVNWEDNNDVSWQVQDGGKTLKVFVNQLSEQKPDNDVWIGTKCPETKLEIKNLNSVKSIEAEIKLLQSKLEFYKELEKTKTPCEEAYKNVYGYYPKGRGNGVWTIGDADSWSAFQDGYNEAQKDYKVGEYQEPEELKTLYQMVYDNKWTGRSCDEVCEIVKEWMSQYTHNVLSGEYLRGYEDCMLVLEENLK